MAPEALLRARPALQGDALICAEGPGFMNLGLAEKGLLWARFTGQATPSQGMVGQAGQNAIVRLAQVLQRIDALNSIQVEPPADLAVLKDNAGAHGLRLSANIGTISGGRFISQSPEKVSAEVDFRLPPGLTLEALGQRLDAIVAEAPGVSWERIKGWEANWTPPDAQVCRAVADACLEMTRRAPSPVVRLPASDAARWRAGGVPAVCFGPQPLLASGVDDYVLRADLLNCVKVYALAAARYLGRPGSHPDQAAPPR